MAFLYVHGLGESANGLGENGRVCLTAAAKNSPEEGGGAGTVEGHPRGGSRPYAGAVRAGERK